MSKDDRANLSRAGSMRPPPPPPLRFPLMTPSASPPVQRPFGRQSVGPPPTKKRRVSRTPSLLGPGARSLSVASESSSSISPAFNFDASVDPEDLHAARRASSFRVLNVWSQLAGKYTRRLDEDDIVDLRKEAIIKDYGILRSSTDMFEIGCFAAEHEKAEQLDNGQPLTPVDDEPDELDAFADIQDNVSRSETDGDEEGGFGLAQQSKRIPPVRELDPDDAADLAEFLKEEQARKEMFGDPDEEDEEDRFEGTEDAEEGDPQESEILDEEDDVEENGTHDITFKSDAEADFTEHEVEEEVADYQESIDDNDDGDWHGRQDYRWLSTQSGSPEFDILGVSYSENDSDNGEATNGANRALAEPLSIASDADSEDELGGWDRDEGSTLYSVGDYSRQSRPSRGDPSQGNPNSRPAPELTSFSFTPPQPASVISPTYDSTHIPPPVPNFQDPNAQYHLAQALQSLSYLMGGALPFPPSPVNELQEPPFPSGPNGQRPWPPYTPRHQHRHMNFETPQSAATAPPTSSPLGSDYSESVPSSPTKPLARDRGRLRTQSLGPKIARPKSAMRESKTPSRSRSRSQRRVSFSSPEATQIEDHAYEVVVEDVIEIDSSEAEDSDFERRRLRRENQSTRSLQLHSLSRQQERAQTPGPPSRRPAPDPEATRKEFYASPYHDPEPRRKLMKNSRASSLKSETSHHASRRERR